MYCYNDDEEEGGNQSAIDMKGYTRASEERDEKKKAAGSCWEQLALLNTLIAITGCWW